MTKHSAKYRPNLVGIMNLCEINYMLILRLLADKELAGEVRYFFINDHLAYKIAVEEVTRYTSLINIAQEVNLGFIDDLTIQSIKVNSSKEQKQFTDMMRPVMQLRLYHDARMVEVISSQNISRVKPRYDYPNTDMHQPDEKEQTLIFLKEWLQLCLKQGLVNVTQQQSS